MPSVRPHILHLHIPNPISYNRASILQDRLISLHQRARKAPKTFLPPPPTVITFSTTPTYTLGRRETETAVTQSQLDYLASPAHIPRTNQSVSAEVVKTLRGGQTTFHGPGQLTIYPIFALDAPTTQIPRFYTEKESLEGLKQKESRYRITPKCYVRLLEESVIAVLGRYGVKGMRTDNPGVWASEEEKIAAVGVHLRRWVVSHGVAVNVKTDLQWFERIVACGLVGKKTTSIQKLLLDEMQGGAKEVPEVEEVARAWVDEFAGRLGFDVERGDVRRDITEEDLLAQEESLVVEDV